MHQLTQRRVSTLDLELSLLTSKITSVGVFTRKKKSRSNREGENYRMFAYVWPVYRGDPTVMTYPIQRIAHPSSHISFHCLHSAGIYTSTTTSNLALILGYITHQPLARLFARLSKSLPTGLPYITVIPLADRKDCKSAFRRLTRIRLNRMRRLIKDLADRFEGKYGGFPSIRLSHEDRGKSYRGERLGEPFPEEFKQIRVLLRPNLLTGVKQKKAGSQYATLAQDIWMTSDVKSQQTSLKLSKIRSINIAQLRTTTYLIRKIRTMKTSEQIFKTQNLKHSIIISAYRNKSTTTLLKYTLYPKTLIENGEITRFSNPIPFLDYKYHLIQLINTYLYKYLFRLIQ